jgi:hypothetical protein
MQLRVDKNKGQPYEDFWDWLRTDGHAIWIISLVFAYAAYLVTTDEA